MFLKTVSIFFTCLALPLSSFAASFLEKNVTYECNNSTLSTCLKDMAKKHGFNFALSDMETFSVPANFSVINMPIESALNYILGQSIKENYAVTFTDAGKTISISILGKNSQSDTPLSKNPILTNNETTPLNTSTENITPQVQDTQEKDPDEGKALIDIPLLPPTTPGGQPMTLREFQNLNYERVPSGVFSHHEGELPPLKPGDKPMTIREFEELNNKNTNTSTTEEEKVLLPPVEPGGAPMTKDEFNKLRYDEEATNGGDQSSKALLPPTTPNGKPMTIQEFKSLQYE